MRFILNACNLSETCVLIGSFSHHGADYHYRGGARPTRPQRLAVRKLTAALVFHPARTTLLQLDLFLVYGSHEAQVWSEPTSFLSFEL